VDEHSKALITKSQTVQWGINLLASSEVLNREAEKTTLGVSKN